MTTTVPVRTKKKKLAIRTAGPLRPASGMPALHGPAPRKTTVPAVTPAAAPVRAGRPLPLDA